MTVELWYGKKPTNRGEQSVLIELYDYLKPRQDHYVLMCNFRTSRGNEIDLVILKSNAIFLVELKHFWRKVAGDREGKWTCYQPDGKEFTFANPYKQVMSRGYDWLNWCERNETKLTNIAGNKRRKELYRPLRFIVFYPDLHPDSDVDIGEHPVKAMGLDKFRTGLPINSTTGLDFNMDEIQTIPQMLKLTRWHIDPPANGGNTIKLEGDIHPPDVRMLVPRSPDPAFKVVHIERGMITIGRDSNCDLAINDASISRKHAEISRQETCWVVTDFDSLNGTFVSYNGDPTTERQVEGSNALKNGSIVRFGEISYTVILDE